MGMYDSFANKDDTVICQLKVGPCLGNFHKEGDRIRPEDFQDAVYADYAGFVVIENHVVVSVTAKLPESLPEGPVRTKWGGPFNPATENLDQHHWFYTEVDRDPPAT